MVSKKMASKPSLTSVSIPHRARSDVRRKSDLAQALAARINQSARDLSRTRMTGPSAAIIWLGRLTLDCYSVAVILDG